MKYLRILTILILAVRCEAQSPNNTNFSEQFRQELKDFMKDENVNGLAFALFNENDIIWQHCLGNSSYGYPITDKTVFSIQSISKNVTALAVMKAQEDNLLELDTPIANYLPDFKINSCFENNPWEKITLRMLLNHTSGLTHEAPIGNNYDFKTYTIKEHLNSINATWLKFPVGESYSYSNLGYDLAANIIERTSGTVFSEYLQTKIFSPLGMQSSTIDNNIIINCSNKTEGYISATKAKHYDIPLLGSGAVYTNLNDFIKYVQLYMNSGKVGNTAIIDSSFLHEMYTIKFFNYGLGSYINKNDDTYYINHNGSGYGYSASFVLYPEYNIGTVLLCNRQVNTFDFCINFLDNYLRNSNLKKNSFVTEQQNKLNGYYFSNFNLINDLPQYHCSNDTLFNNDWEKYIGTYAMVFKGLDFRWYAKLAFSLGFYPQKAYIKRKGATLTIKTNLGESILREFSPGLFFTNGGEVVDFSSSKTTYKNIELKKLK